ncbi:ankyrin repeat-containing domain protein [Aspergillus keveii]|uniref:Ankyrin repeat-containing domain protein n=1 Tax=Aspergillus keveii TaxID=714993 RepID=A0ABR4G9L7_9EURO
MTLQTLPAEILLEIWAILARVPEQKERNGEEEEEEEYFKYERWGQRQESECSEEEKQATANLNALTQTCRSLYNLLNSALYAHAAQHKATAARLGEWTGRKGQMQTLARFIAAGGRDALLAPETTPLFAAAKHGQTGVLRLLLDDLAVDVGMVQRRGRELTALELAAESGSIPVAELLLAAGASIHTSVLCEAIGAGHEGMVRFLLDNGADPNETTMLYVPLALAASIGFDGILGLLLERGADPLYVQPWGDTPLGGASSKGHYACVKRLLDAGVPLEVEDERPRTPLISALEHGHNDVALLLAQRGAGLNPVYSDRCYTPLIWAVRNGHVELVELLLETGADVHAGTQHARPGAPIIVAALHGQAGIVKLLLAHGADPAACNSRGYTALAIAAQRGWLDVVLALLEDVTPPGFAHTVEPGEEDDVSTSGLRIDSQRRGRDIIDKPDLAGRTALFHATANGHDAIVAVLLSRGSKAVDLESSAGRSPRSIMEQWFTGPKLAIDRPATSAIREMFDDPTHAANYKSPKGQEQDDTTILRHRTMAELITCTTELDLWLYLGFETMCYDCQTPLSQYSEIFACGNHCKDTNLRVCVECMASRGKVFKDWWEPAGHKLVQTLPFLHPPPWQPRWMSLREKMGDKKCDL